MTNTAASVSGIPTNQYAALGSQWTSLVNNSSDTGFSASGVSTSDVLNGYNVYMGNTTANQANAEGDLNKGSFSTPNIVNQSTAYMQFYALNPLEQKAIGSKLYRAGIISDPSDMDSIFSQWSSAVDYAGRVYTATNGKTKITPWDALQTRIGLAQAAYNKAHPTNTDRTTTSTATDVLTNGDANNMITAMYQNQLGRNPDKGELSRYRSMLINKSESNPTVTNTTTHYDKTGNATTQNSVQTGGYSSDAANSDLTSKIQADPDWGAYQAATTYMQAIEGLFSAPNLAGGSS